MIGKRFIRSHFEVHTRIGFDDWENVWTEDGVPMTFATEVEAEQAMAEAIYDADGLIEPDSLRVVEVEE